MGRRTFITGVTVALMGLGLTAFAEDNSMGKDLGATIALHGQPCGKVVQAKRNGDSDYTATCEDGNRYHVFVDSSGRVVVQKL